MYCTAFIKIILTLSPTFFSIPFDYNSTPLPSSSISKTFSDPSSHPLSKYFSYLGLVYSKLQDAVKTESFAGLLVPLWKVCKQAEDEEQDEEQEDEVQFGLTGSD